MKKMHVKQVFLFVTVLFAFLTFQASAISGTDKAQEKNMVFARVELGEEFSGKQFEVAANGQENTALLTVQNDGVLMLELSGGSDYIIREKSKDKESIVLTTENEASFPDAGVTTDTAENQTFLKQTPQEALLFGYIPRKSIVFFAVGITIAIILLLTSSRDVKKQERSNVFKAKDSEKTV